MVLMKVLAVIALYLGGKKGEHTATPSCKRVWKMSVWLLKTQ